MKTYHAPRGYTLVETLVAIAILMIAIVIPFYSVQKAIQAANISRDQLIASSLGEEAMEYVYYVRDNNFFYYNTNGSYPSGGWLAGLSACTGTNGCMIDPTQNTVTACTSGGCTALNRSSSNIYTYGAGTATTFVRTVKIQTINAHESRVIVTVSGNTSHQAYTATVTETIYNWL
jgi:type II secretory pathway pseudopilin PulG